MSLALQQLVCLCVCKIGTVKGSLRQFICGKTVEEISGTHTSTLYAHSQVFSQTMDCAEPWQDHLFLLKSAQQEPTGACAHTQTHTVAACFTSGIVIVYLFLTLTQVSI